jgi:hypothetical protein
VFNKKEKNLSCSDIYLAPFIAEKCPFLEAGEIIKK